MRIQEYEWKLSWSKDKRFDLSGSNTAFTAILLPFISAAYIVALPIAFLIFRIWGKK